MRPSNQNGSFSSGGYVLDGLTCFFGSIAALCFLGATGCVHKAPELPAKTVSRAPVVVKLPPAEPAARPAPTPEADLEAVLSGAVLQFEFDRAVLTKESTQRLERIAEALKAHPAVRVKISGHCDERGTEEYNVNLGQQRAQAARAFLVALGIDGARVETVSYGAEAPVDQGHDEQAWAKNRRDEFKKVQ